MRYLVLMLMACGPFAPNVVGRTCDAGPGTQHCASPTSYAACNGNIWREYPCPEACMEGGKCALEEVKAGTLCAPSWGAVGVCKAPRLAMFCNDGGWQPHTCDECYGTSCLACSCK